MTLSVCDKIKSIIVAGLLFEMPLASATITGADIDSARSLLIVNSGTLNNLNQSFDFGVQLGRLGEYNRLLFQDRLPSWRRAWTPGRFVENAFSVVYNEQLAHQASPPRQKLGGNIGRYRFMDSIFRNWMPAPQLAMVQTVAGLRNGPFRLIGIVNRMDLAGDFDDRGSSPPTNEPRSMGELHLTYGLVDSSYERKTGQAFPMTFVIVYRLPALAWGPAGLAIDSSLTQGEIAARPWAWKHKMANWAYLWRDLSRYPLNSAEYNNRLRVLLSKIVRPENFLHLRSNTKVNDQEHELREWYMLQLTQTLIIRRPRNEPYKCAAQSPDLTNIINVNWRWQDQDLDMRTRDSQYRRFDGLNGYGIPRDNVSPLLLGRASYPGCGTKDAINEPFGMYSEGSEAVPGVRALFIPPFARTSPDWIWRLESRELWDISDTF